MDSMTSLNQRLAVDLHTLYFSHTRPAVLRYVFSIDTDSVVNWQFSAPYEYSVWICMSVCMIHSNFFYIFKHRTVMIVVFFFDSICFQSAKWMLKAHQRLKLISVFNSCSQVAERPRPRPWPGAPVGTLNSTWIVWLFFLWRLKSVMMWL